MVSASRNRTRARTRAARLAAATLVAFALTPSPSFAQQLSFEAGRSGPGARVAEAAIAAPATQIRRAAPDFATDVLGDPWDFQERSDYVYMFSGGWSGVPTVANGKVTGTAVNGVRPTLQLQFQGVDGALNLFRANGAPFAAINADYYRRLSFRMRRSNMSNDTLGATWMKHTTLASGVGGKLAYRLEATRSPASVRDRSDRFHVYTIDLDLTGNNSTYGEAWGGIVRGIQLHTGQTGLGGATIEVDWVRLTPRNVLTTGISIGSGFGGNVTIVATHVETGDLIQVVDVNGATSFPQNSTTTWDIGFLAPGTYSVVATGPNGSSTDTLIIDPAPVIQITEPDASGGRDFATAVLADAWDLTNPEDVLRYGRTWDVRNISYTPEGLTGTSTTADTQSLYPGAGTDAFVQLIDDWGDRPGTEFTIDANTYRRLTFTIEYTDRKDLTGGEALSGEWGGVVRVNWREVGQSAGGFYTGTQDIVLLDGGPATYSLNLPALTLGNGQLESGQGSHVWGGLISNLRIDIHEGTRSRTFRLANVKLAADDAPNGNGVFVVKWRVFDAVLAEAVASSSPAGSDALVTLYYAPVSSPGTITEIASNIPATDGQYAWRPSGVAAGSYYIYAVIQDTPGNAQGRYSTGPVSIPSALPAFTDSGGNGLADWWEARYGLGNPNDDPDGDGVSNLDEYRNATDPLVSNDWILAEGSTSIFDERIALANPETGDAQVTITFLRPAPQQPIVRTYIVPGRQRLTVDVNTVNGLNGADSSAVIRVDSGVVVAERSMFWMRGGALYGGHTGKAVPRARTTWYLAEGDAGFFRTYILLANENASPITVHIDYLRADGTVVARDYSVGARSRRTIETNTDPALSGWAFSSTITAPLPITVERAMYFDNGRRFFESGHNAAAVEQPSQSWFVAEGATGSLFRMYLLLANPNPHPVTANIRYLRRNDTPIEQTVVLKPTSRETIEVNRIRGLENTDVSASIDATDDIIVERSMYWPGQFPTWYEAHNSAGVTSMGTRWAFAEGEMGGSQQFASYFLFANPNNVAATVTITLLRTNAPPITLTRTVPANSRETLEISNTPSTSRGLSSGERFGALIESTQPIVTERAMYWTPPGEPQWTGGTNEVGTKLQ